MRSFRSGSLEVIVADSTASMADMAASWFAESVRALLREQQEINVVFSGAESQAPFHAALCGRAGIEWQKINAFAVDEFYAPGMAKENAVAAQPARDLYAHVPMKSVNVINFAPRDPETERRRYEELIARNPPHIACLGIGISGHIALNEPGGTDFNDSQRVRFVKVREDSKRQLKQDPNFRALPAIPGAGFTITIPTLMEAPVVLVVVPYAIKAEIVGRLMRAPVSPGFPRLGPQGQGGSAHVPGPGFGGRHPAGPRRGVTGPAQSPTFSRTSRRMTFLFRKGVSCSKTSIFPTALPIRPPVESRIRLSSWGSTYSRSLRIPSARVGVIFCAPTTQITLEAAYAYGASWLPVRLPKTSSPVWATACALPR